MMEKSVHSRRPTVNEVNEFLETASDFENPLELIREALSNSYDARAENVEIQIDELSDGRTRIRIKDDGVGMDADGLASFFDLGNSNKSNSIGYKGHGTKIYYKSDSVTVETVKDGSHYHAEMEQPWKRLNNHQLPEYQYQISPADEASFTKIEIVGFRSGDSFSSRKITYNRLDHYINWKTIGGSLAHRFDEDAHEMTISLELDDSLDRTQGTLSQSSRFKFPPKRTDFETTSDVDNLCKHYPKKILTVNVDGKEVQIEVVGFVAGKAAREELPTHGRHSSQFGVWLAKDHIKVERVNDVIGSDHEPSRFFFVANCQALELSANRETIRNKSDSVYSAVKAELRRFITRVTENEWYREYTEARRAAQQVRASASQSESIANRKQQLSLDGHKVPSNPPEVIASLAIYNETADSDIRVVDYEPGADANAILTVGEKLEAATLVVNLHEIFESELTVSELERIVCWSLGDLDVLCETARKGYFGHSIDFVTRGDQTSLVVDGEEVPIVELRSSLY
ncbi:ATP-binding protein [Haloprofundus salilacus]|uniref:ATP-binding protein n=1 Tax=Haloprofundus salilacus TaxID=2876190 RepID=UPI001CCAAC7A|nr:ATP-binding protein [Haloprofundus salilacus]